jgi:hypothetical protein
MILKFQWLVIIDNEIIKFVCMKIKVESESKKVTSELKEVTSESKNVTSQSSPSMTSSYNAA